MIFRLYIILLFVGTLLVAQTYKFECLPNYTVNFVKKRYDFHDAEKLKLDVFAFIKEGEEITDQGGIHFAYHHSEFDGSIVYWSLERLGTVSLLEKLVKGFQST
jgi:hypothetical protein